MGKFGHTNNRGGFGTESDEEGICIADCTTYDPDILARMSEPGTVFGYWEYQLWAACTKENVTDGKCFGEKTDDFWKDKYPCKLDSPSKGKVKKKCQAGLVMRPADPKNRPKKDPDKWHQAITWKTLDGGKHPWRDACWLWHGNNDCGNSNKQGNGPFWRVDFCGLEPMGTGDAGGQGVAAAQGSSNVELIGACEIGCSGEGKFGHTGGGTDKDCLTTSGTVKVFPNPMSMIKDIYVGADLYFECCKCGVEKVPD